MNPGQLLSVGNHLWQSTCFAAFAGLLTLAFRKNRAQVRYWLWLAASVKFFFPFSLLIEAGSHFGRPTTAATMPSDLSFVVQQVSVPFTVSVSPQAIPATHTYNFSLIPVILCAVWAIGFALLVCSWWLRWRRMRAGLRAASPSNIGLDIKVLPSPAFGEPGVFGIARPMLLLPEGIAERLTPSQLEAILAHELCHVRRRDNLAPAIHMAVEAIFWFYPLVWWLGARLMEERERACDEEVLRMGSEPQVYAEGILKICELFLESPLQFVAGVTGGNLKRRIEEIMIDRVLMKLSLAKKAALVVVGATALVMPVVVGILNAPAVRAQSQAGVHQWETAAGGKMAFEVASVKQSKPDAWHPPNFPLDSGDAFINMPTGESPRGRFTADFPLSVYISFAYKLMLSQEQMKAMIAHLPKWVSTDSFDIQARAPGNPTKDQMRLMMQSLLADRFSLTVHFETQEVPVLALTPIRAGKMGPKLRPHAEGPPCDASPIEVARGTVASDAEIFPNVCDVQALIRRNGRNMAGSRNTTMALLAASMSGLGQLGRPVVDQTGFTGSVDYRLEWTPESNTPAIPGADSQPDSQAVTFVDALREQLGLKLESTKGPIETLVIDRVERPSEN